MDSRLSPRSRIPIRAALLCLARVLIPVVAGGASARAANVSIKPVCGAVPIGYARCFSLASGPLAMGPSGYGPADLQSAYALPSATAGSGQTVAIVDAFDDPTAESDLAQYRAFYGLSPCPSANGCLRKAHQSVGSLSWAPPSPHRAMMLMP